MSPGGPHSATSPLRAYLAFKAPPYPPEKGVLTFSGGGREGKDAQTGFSQADSSGPVVEPWGSF